MVIRLVRPEPVSGRVASDIRISQKGTIENPPTGVVYNTYSDAMSGVSVATVHVETVMAIINMHIRHMPEVGTRGGDSGLNMNAVSAKPFDVAIRQRTYCANMDTVTRIAAAVGSDF